MELLFLCGNRDGKLVKKNESWGCYVDDRGSRWGLYGQSHYELKGESNKAATYGENGLSCVLVRNPHVEREQ